MSTTTVTTTIQRPMRGSRVASFYPVKSLPSLASLESAFQIQEYISLLIRHDVHDVDRIVALPERHNADEKTIIDADEAKGDDKDGDRKSEMAVDRACWIYEHLRRLAQDLTHPLITMLQQECTRVSCREMKAGEWLYLCVAHGNDGAMEQCCAIDYILHTLDSATALLNSPRAFPSRLSIPQTSYRHFSSLARRLGRIFAHAYFHHREAFEQAEAESSLYARFLKLTSQFDLVPAEFLVIPEHAVSPDAHGKDGEGVEPPKLASAAVSHEAGDHQTSEAQGGAEGRGEHPASVLAPKSPASGYDKVGTDSPRRMGRSRTDTMIFSEGYAVAEELAKGSASPASSGGSTLLDQSPSQTQAPAVSLPHSHASAAGTIRGHLPQMEDGSWRDAGAPEDISALDVPGDADEYGDDMDDDDDEDGEGEVEGHVDEVDEIVEAAGAGTSSPPLEELPAMTLAGIGAEAVAEAEASADAGAEAEEKAEEEEEAPSAEHSTDSSAAAPADAEDASAEGPTIITEAPLAEIEPAPDASAAPETAPADEAPAPTTPPAKDELEVPMEEGDIAPSPAKEKAHTEALDEAAAGAHAADHPPESDITDEGVHAHDESEERKGAGDAEAEEKEKES
ncbi:Mob1 phocein [Coniophora puteana RWD-64-598 SS2]|uniref:Mob1 phocein n=1 Tax=Coniophora puteana (strain RWD-64-598) TaxID=741705 RepID=A0A5M3ME61_CONPW|nr:Mob1 phocein [Coniophora puteana RWD-64-598 SS2]EIW77296.1 Mob1 phocein [Coniophora puteana RWD-64-598 SS2]